MDGLYTGNREFVPRAFVSVDARQNAFVDHEQVRLRQSGLTGGVPAMMLMSAQPQAGFDYTMSVVGIGGTPSPIAYGVAAPLIAQADFAASFLGAQT